jgi:transcriptional regulator with XRE-family HTH domain
MCLIREGGILMGRYSRQKPARLAEKLLHIRMTLGLSQNEIIWRLGLDDVLTQSRISGYELGTREPSLPTLLEYARLAGVSTDVLIDDEIDLPDRLPVASEKRGAKWIAPHGKRKR